jgi:aryl-alcohol dehydrogenase-like predicted oxidoreductase
VLPQRPFGTTSKTVSVLGCGGAFLAAQSRDDGIASVRRALELGVTYFDTSPMYAAGQSQPIIGEALRGRREPHLLATKLGYLPRRSDHRSLDALRQQIRDNVRLLGRDSVDVLQLHEADLAHWWTDDATDAWRIKPDRDYDFANAPAMQVLRESKQQGLCRYIGITGNGEPEMTRLLEALDVDVFLLAFHYDVLHRDARNRALPMAQQKGVAFVAAGYLQCGNLAAVHPEWLDTPPKWMTPGLREAYRRLYALQAQCGLPLPELGIRYLLRDPSPSVILTGPRMPAELEQTVAAVQKGPLPDDLHAAVESLVPASL